MVILLNYNHKFFLNHNQTLKSWCGWQKSRETDPGLWALQAQLGEAVSEKSAPQQTEVKELTFISRSLVQWLGDRGGLQSNSGFGFEKLFCRNRCRACCQSKGNLSVNSAFSCPAEDSQLTQVDVMVSIINKGFWPPLQQKNGAHYQLDHPGSQVVRAELLWGPGNVVPSFPLGWQSLCAITVGDKKK